MGWLKLGLPLVGLGILSILFFFARETRIEQGEMPEEFFAPDGAAQTVKGPHYTGVTGDGTRVDITAALAWPEAGGDGRYDASDVLATFEMADGDHARVHADRGAVEPARDVLELRENVVVQTESGWTLRSQQLNASLDWTRLVSPGHVETEGPMGVLNAGNMLIHRDTGPEGTYLMEFDGGVHLVYRP